MLFAHARRRWLTSATADAAAAAVAHAPEWGDSDMNRKAEAGCGMTWKMSYDPRGAGDDSDAMPPPAPQPRFEAVKGRAFSQVFDQVIHEIRPDGTDCKLAFCPSFSDARQYGPDAKRWGAMQMQSAKDGVEMYLEFNMYTEGIGTQRALRRIADDVGVDVRDLSVASLKDRHAIATQRAAVRDCTWKQLSLLNDMFELRKDLKVGDFKLASEPVGIGETLGNRVDYVIRNVPHRPLDNLAAAVRRVRQFGFVNYLGYQRFSLGAERQAFDVAAGMLRGDWRGACDALLACRSHATRAALEAFRENRYEDAMAMLAEVNDAQSTPLTPQLQMLEVMAASGDAREALLAALPPLLRGYCLSSLQSYVWNAMASTRLREGGYHVRVGDIVYDKHHDEHITVGSPGDASQFTLQDVRLPLLGIHRDDDGRPLPPLYPELPSVDRAAHEAFLQQRFGLGIAPFEEAAGQAAIFHGVFRPVWAGCSTLQCYVVPAVSKDDATPVLVTDNMVMERTHFNLRVTPVVAADEFIKRHADDVERTLRSSADASDFSHGMHVILSAVLPGSAYPHMMLREVAHDVALSAAPVMDHVL